jgi:hypothetical protein
MDEERAYRCLKEKSASGLCSGAERGGGYMRVQYSGARKDATTGMNDSKVQTQEEQEHGARRQEVVWRRV